MGGPKTSNQNVLTYWGHLSGWLDARSFDFAWLVHHFSQRQCGVNDGEKNIAPKTGASSKAATKKKDSQKHLGRQRRQKVKNVKNSSAAQAATKKKRQRKFGVKGSLKKKTASKAVWGVKGSQKKK